jgi:two-component system response regulator MprA
MNTSCGDPLRIENVPARVPGQDPSSTEYSVDEARRANDVQGAHVLVVDVNKRLHEPFSQWMHREGFGVRVCGDMSELLSLSSAWSADVIIVAIDVTGVDPYSPLRHLRKRERRVPLLACLDEQSTLAEVLAYEAGADDCFSKTEDPILVEARIRGALRRSLTCKQCNACANTSCLPQGSAAVGQNDVALGVELAALTRFEEQLLKVLMRNLGNTVPRTLVIKELWKDSTSGSSRLYHHVSTLRNKLIPLGWTVANERNKGYRLDRVLGNPISSGRR